MAQFNKMEANSFQSSLNILEVGDVILCTGKAGDKKDPVGASIKAVTGSKYAHAAIYLGDDTIAEAVIGDGVRKKDFKELLDKYGYIRISQG